MRALLDSHTALWAVSDPKRLPVRTRALIEDPDNEMLISYASLWELSIKVAKGKLHLPGKSVAQFIGQIATAGFSLLRIEQTHILRTETLPHIHKDPFDRMIVAQAIEENLVILTVDNKIPLYPVTVIWD